MTYEVPAYRVNKLEKLVNRAIRRGGNISMSVGDSFYKTRTINEYDSENHCTIHRRITVKYVNVTIEGEYKVNGFDFVATIEHTDAGNIIRSASSKYERIIPHKYLTCGPECEHCNRIRNRKDTYLVYNETTNEFKQVGKQCLMDFTNGLTNETVQAFADVFTYCEKNADEDDEFKEFLNGKCSDCMGYDSNEIKTVAIAIINKFGYKKSDSEESTKDSLYGYLYVDGSRIRKMIDIPENDDGTIRINEEEIRKIDEYADSIEDDIGFLYNGKIAWKNHFSSYRDFGIICAFIYSYYKHIEELKKEEENRNSSEYVGNIGDKIEIDVKSCRVLYTKTNEYGYHNWCTSYVYEIIDNNGNTFIWSTSNDLTEAKKIIATVKEFKEFRGTKQTVVTRGKVVE